MFQAKHLSTIVGTHIHMFPLRYTYLPRGNSLKRIFVIRMLFKTSLVKIVMEN